MSNFQSNESCIACGTMMTQRTYHHIYTRKAYPEFTHEPWNKISLCLKCHNEWHNKGTDFMANKYENVMKWLNFNGWEYVEFLKKWCRNE